MKSPSPYKSCEWMVTQSPGGTINPCPPTPIKKRIGGMSGIYGFKHLSSERRYVGSALDLLKRFRGYKSALKNQNNGQHILRAMRLYSDFHAKIYGIYPDINETDLHQKEEGFQDMLQTRDRKFGFNHSRPTLEPRRWGIKRKRSSEKKVEPKRPRSTRAAAQAATEKIREIIRSEILVR